MMDADLRVLEETELLDPDWYSLHYGDAELMGLTPAQHYLKFGAALGRNPGPNFSTKVYLATYRDVAESRMNPLVHYVRYGKEEGRDPLPGRQDGATRGQLSVARHRYGLYVQGHTESVLARLHTSLEQGEDPYERAFAARELALWFIRGPLEHAPERALRYVRQALALWSKTSCQSDAGQRFQDSLRVLQVTCHAAAKVPLPERMELTAGQESPNVLLAHTHLETTPQARLRWINQCLSCYDLSPLHLLAGCTGQNPFDRLSSNEGDPVDCQTSQPCVTVLVAAYNAEATLPAALRSLQAQSWKNLEIVVIDDASTDETARVVAQATAQDARIRLLSLPQNGGAYVARNAGLDIATGDFITLHDADDWAHPKRIATQAAHLQTSGEFGCCSEQVRLNLDLTVSRLSPEATFIFENTASYMFRRAPMRDRFGYWDSVRVSADSELIRRARHIFGAAGARSLNTGPMVLQRDTATSAVRDTVLGINGFAYGARREYREAQMHFHAQARGDTALRYRASRSGHRDAQPFLAPKILTAQRVQPENNVAAEDCVDIVLCGDFRPLDEAGLVAPAGLVGALLDLQSARRAGHSVALMQYDSDDPARALQMIHPEIRDVADRLSIRVLTYGETIRCDRFILHNPEVLMQRPRYLPRIIPKAVCVIAHRAPRYEIAAKSKPLYDPAHCDAVLRAQFKVAPQWIPQSEVVFTALQRAVPDIDLSPVGG